MIKCQEASHFPQQRCLRSFGSIPRFNVDIHVKISNMVLLGVTVHMQDKNCSSIKTTVKYQFWGEGGRRQ